MSDFPCVFCGEMIASTREPVTSLLVTANWETEELQQLFCHLDCLKSRCACADFLYLEEKRDKDVNRI